MGDMVVLATVWVVAIVAGMLFFYCLIERQHRMTAQVQAQQKSQTPTGLAFGVWAIAGPDALGSIVQSFWLGVSPEGLAEFRRKQQAAIEELGGFQFIWVTPRPREVVERLGLLLAEHLRQRGVDRGFEPGEAYRLALQTGLLAAAAMADAYETERVPEGGKR